MPTNNSSSDSFLKILQWNTRSLPACLIDIPNFLFSNAISIALFSETWLRPNMKIKIPGYNLVRCDRPDGYGGAAIAISNSLRFRNLSVSTGLSQSLSLHNINLVGVEIIFNDNKNLDIWSCYIPPHANISQTLVNNIFNVISINCIFGGDLNGHHTCCGSDKIDHQGNLFYSVISDLQLFSIMEPLLVSIVISAASQAYLNMLLVRTSAPLQFGGTQIVLRLLKIEQIASAYLDVLVLCTIF